MNAPRPRGTTALLAVFLAFWITSSVPAYELQSAGQVVIHAPTNSYTVTTSTAWTDLAAMKGAVTLPKGGDLVITLTVEGNVTGRSTIVYVRALVDDQATSTSLIKLFANPTGLRTTTVTFVKKGLAAGTHRVRIQWQAYAGTTATAYDRTLVLRFASPDSPHMRLVHVEAASISRQSGSWVDIPGLAASVVCPWDADLLVTVSGEFKALFARKRIFLRAMLEGKVAGPTDYIVATGDSEGNRSVTFKVPMQKKGTRQLRIQWLADDSSLVLYPALTVVVVPHGPQKQTGLLHQTPVSGPLVSCNSTSFTAVPGVGGHIAVPVKSDLTVRFSAETIVSCCCINRFSARLSTNFLSS